MNRRRIAIATLLVLVLCACLFAAAEEATDPVYPGQSGTHEHDVQIKIKDRGYTAHLLHEWCPGCGRLLNERLEGHSFEEGVCTVCDWECPHPPEAAVKHTERDGVKPQWDGNYIICPGWEVTECSICGMELSRVETTVREFHNLHTHFTPVLGCVPYDSIRHALIRFCDECGTEVPTYAVHNCPSSDAPYTDDGDIDTHVRYVKCDDCGDMIPQRQAHKWVHEAYTEFDGMGDYHNEVMRCSICCAIKQVPRLHEWKLISCRADDNEKTHIGTYECKACGEWKEAAAPHELEHDSYKNDGDTNMHIDVQVCTGCGQKVELRTAHKPMHIIWESVSDTQDRENVICNMCGLEYVKTPVAHTFNDQAYVSDGNDSTSHTKYSICTKCGLRKSLGVKEAHTWNNGEGQYFGYCTKCKEAYQHSYHSSSGMMSPVGYNLIDENSHDILYRCGKCYQIYSSQKVEAHSFDPVTMKCTGCGYLKEGCEHRCTTYTPVKNGSTEEYHTLIGICTNCGKQITVTGVHDMQFASDRYEQRHPYLHLRTVTDRCSVCGHEKNWREYGYHDMQFVSASKYVPCENGHTCIVTERCSYCGYEADRTEKTKHDMQIVSATEYVSIGNSQHTRTVIECCSQCGDENQYTETEDHSLSSSGESINVQEHRQFCSKCNGYSIQPHSFVCTSDESAHVCSVCNEKGEHDYSFAECKDNRGWKSHTCVYQCQGCAHQIEKLEKHSFVYSYRIFNEARHVESVECTACSFKSRSLGEHVFDENGVCDLCDYHQGDPIPEAPLSGEGLSESTGDLTTAMPIFCHLTADGKEILCEYAFEPTEDGDAIGLILLPESAPENTDFEVLFPASELELLQVLGVKNIYLHLNGNDILLLNDIEQTLTILSEQETDELLIILTHEVGSDGAYTAVYVPQGNE